MHFLDHCCRICVIQVITYEILFCRFTDYQITVSNLTYTFERKGYFLGSLHDATQNNFKLYFKKKDTMMTKVLLSETMDPHILVSGDVIGFQVDTLGLLCTSSANEPIPENEDRVSHLRVCTTHKKPSTADYRRCMFKIENDSGEVSLTCCNVKTCFNIFCASCHVY